MKKKLLIPAGLVLLVAAVVLGIGFYEKMVLEQINQHLRDLPPGMEAGAQELRYSFWNDQLACDEFYLRYSGPGPADFSEFKTGAAEIYGLNLKAFTSPEISELASQIVIKNLDGRASGLVNGNISLEHLALENLRGPFGRLRELARQRAGLEEMLPLAYQLSLGRLQASSLAGYYPPDSRSSFRFDSFVIDGLQGRRISAWKTEDLTMSGLSFLTQGVEGLTCASLSAGYELDEQTPLPGRNFNLFRYLFSLRPKARVEIKTQDIQVIPDIASPASEIASPSFNIAGLNFHYTKDEALSLALALEHLKLNLSPSGGLTQTLLAETLGGRGFDLSLDLNSRLGENEFFPSQLELVVQDLARLDISLQLSGMTLDSLRLRQAEIRYADQGLFAACLRLMSDGSPAGAEQARCGLLARLGNAFSAYQHIEAARALSGALSAFIIKPGVLSLAMAPLKPLTWRELLMAFLLAPSSLNFTVANE
jgi:hypothetical protein